MPAGTSRLALLMRNRKRKGMKAFRMKMKLQHEAASKVQSLIRAKLGRRAYLKTLEKIVIAQSTGHGDYTYTDGSRYVGVWQRGRRHGKGIFFDRHGRKIYEGDWDDDRRSGEGKIWVEDGSIYTGQVQDGLMNGVGTLEYSDGRKYIGEFKKGSKEGKGEEHSANGVLIYYGRWSKGLRVGKGESILRPTKDGKRRMKLKVFRF